MRQQVRSGAKWEDIAGYSLAVRVGNTIEVAGTGDTATLPRFTVQVGLTVWGIDLSSPKRRRRARPVVSRRDRAPEPPVDSTDQG